MKNFSDGIYALYTTEDGKAVKLGQFTISNGELQYTDEQSKLMIGDMFPPGKVSSSLHDRCVRYLGHHHGYMHLEQVK
jgi:hypothetical protein